MIAYPRTTTWNRRLAPPGCIAYWLLSAGGGTTVRDLSPSGYHGTFVGAPPWGPSRYGSHLSGFTTSDHVRWDQPGVLLGSVYPFWWAFLASSVGTETGYSWAICSASSTHRIGLYTTSGISGINSYFSGTNEASMAAGTSVLNDGAPHVILHVSRSATDHVLWLDGYQQQTSATNPGTFACDRLLLGCLRYGGADGNAMPNTRAHALLLGQGAVPDVQKLTADLLSGRFSAVRPRPLNARTFAVSEYTKSASASFVLTPVASEVGGFPESAAVSFALTPTASEVGVFPESAAVSLTMTVSASEAASFSESASVSFAMTVSASVGSVGHTYSASASPSFAITVSASEAASFSESASVSFAMTVSAVAAVARGALVSASVSFRLSVRAGVKVPEVVFGEVYLGRFQAGQEVPLWSIVRDERGRPASPTSVPPLATIYRLGAARGATVPVPKLRGSRVAQVHATAMPIGPGFPPGQYAAVVRARTGAFRGDTLARFEVVPGGDAQGPVQAVYAIDHPAGTTFIEHTGCGSLLTGRRPRVE